MNLNKLWIACAVILLITPIIAVDAATVLEAFWVDGQRELGSTITITDGDSAEFFVWPTTDTPPMDLDIRLYDSENKVIKVYESHKTINDEDYSKTYTLNPSDYDSEGNYKLHVVVKAGTETKWEDLTLKVIPSNDGINHPPVLTPIGDRAVYEEKLLTFPISATDSDGDALSFTSTSLPSGAKLIDNKDSTATLSWTPTSSQAGNYPVTFTVKDTKNAQDSETITITVKEPIVPEQHPPVLAPIGNKITDEGKLLTVKISATDADGDRLGFSAENLPAGAVLRDNNDNTATFSWTPDYSQAGTYTVTFAVFDNNHGYDSEQITITVRDIQSELDPGFPLAPYDPHPYHRETGVNPSESLTWKAGTSPGLVFDVYFGTDATPDNTELVSKGQSNRYYNPAGNLALSTTYYWKIVVRDRDGDETAGPVWQFTTANSIITSNHPPVIEPIPDQIARVGVTFTYDVEASDPEKDRLTYDIFDGRAYVDSNPNPVKIDARTGVITFTPTSSQIGDKLYLTVEVRDNAGGIAKESFTLTILGVDNRGGFDDDDDRNDDRKPKITTVVRNGACRNDYDGDRFGSYEQIRETVDLYTGTILAREVLNIDCLLEGKTEIVITGEKEDNDGINWFLVALITALFAAIALLITWLGTREKEQPRPFKWQSGPTTYQGNKPTNNTTKAPKSYY